MLSNLFIKNIKDALSRSSLLDIEDFQIILPEEGNSKKQIKIYYTFDDSYYFNATINSALRFMCEFSPGKIMLTQTINFDNEENYFNAIEDWVDRLEDEFTSTPLAKTVIQNQTNIKELKQKVDELFEDKELNPNEQFSSQEAQEMEFKLEEFKKLIEEKLETEINEKITLKNEVRKLFREIEFLKDQMQKLTKKNWFTAFITKTTKFVKNNPETTKAITQTTKHLLPEGIKEIIPDDATNIVNTLIDERTKA